MNADPLMFYPDSVDFVELSSLPHDINKITPPRVYRDETIAFLNGADTMHGATLPWPKTFDMLRFRPGEVTLWMGINGHGKSLLSSHVMLDFVHQQQKILICSFEMKPKATLARMVKQAATSAKPSDRFVDAMFAHATGKLWLYDKMGQTDPAHLLNIMRYAARKLGIQHFVIDSLMKVVKGEDDYNGQKDFVDSVCAFAQDFNVHVHIIHHSRKLADENTIPGKLDAKGSGSITDQVDQSLIVWRNKKKEEARRSGKDFESLGFDCILKCDKNRHGQWEGMIGLHYTPGVSSYSESVTPMNYNYRDWMSAGEVSI